MTYVRRLKVVGVVLTLVAIITTSHLWGEPAKPVHGKRPARTTYAITPEGEAEFQRLLREYWWEFKTVIDPFQVALAFTKYLPREELLAALRHRAAAARSKVDELELAIRSKTGPDTPPQFPENLRLAADHVEVNARWAEAAIEKVERGDWP